jgi:hypothetical protein
MGPRLMGRLLLDKDAAQTATSVESSPPYEVQVLAPGVLYPYDYSSMTLVMKNRSPVFESLIHRSKPYGVHFYGTGSTSLSLEINSTMGLLVRENSIFGTLPHMDVVRIPGARYCHSSDGDVINIREKEFNYLTQNANKLEDIMITYPSDLHEFHEMARRAGCVLFCHKDWLGIRQNTLRMSNSLGIPVIMVADATLKEHMSTVKEALDVMGIRKLHFQGIPPNTLEFASYLRSSITPHATKNKFIYEWIVSVSFQSVTQGESALLARAMAAAANGDILLTFSGRDQAYHSTRSGAPACAVHSTFADIPEFVGHDSLKASADPSVIRVGLLGTGAHLAAKTYITQIAAACMFHNAEIHVNILHPSGLAADDAMIWTLDHCKSRIVEHGVLDHETFQKVLSTFDINLFISRSVAVPDLALDSLAAGVPVIVSDVTDIFDYSPKLKSLLVETRADDPNAIYHRAVRALEYVKQHKDEFHEEIVDQFIKLRENAFFSWRCFQKSTVVDKTCLNEKGKCLAMARY